MNQKFDPVGIPKDSISSENALAAHLLKAAKRLFGIPDFRLYALADGIREVCAKSPRRSQPGAKDPSHSPSGSARIFLGNVLI